MRTSIHSIQNPQRIGCLQQTVANVDGMTLAFERHYPANWTSHWRGICRAICSERFIVRKGVSDYAASL